MTRLAALPRDVWKTVRRWLPARRKRSPPPLSAPAYWAVGVGLVVGLVGLLVLYGRPVLGPPGFLLVGPSEGSLGSSALFDGYTILHGVYGMGLRLLLRRTSGHWPAPWLVLVTVAAAVTWEAVENLPLIAEAFSLEPAAAYEGDTILNALGDVAAALVGYGLAAALPWPAAVATAVALEIGLVAVGFDGIASATWKVLAGAA
ncbi:DUF2585 family protein [Chthonobacter rhizosphaerae]|uniref:DUF2585 family protein n=1 Tax=Chthonobacter rhizosphaerae TaxID=2735553 RepID=UPI0015EE6B0C|nr:DUF2585 family protein [Chthonobacter rhizosphaerae]